MRSNPEAARKVLESAFETWMHRSDLMELISEAVGFLRGYDLSETVLANYRCSFCGVSGVKLWRAAHSDEQAWCAKCGTAQAGLPDDIDEYGKRQGEYGESDQIYSSDQGKDLLPFIPTLAGLAWGYSSVPPEGVLWWTQLPTRKE